MLGLLPLESLSAFPDDLPMDMASWILDLAAMAKYRDWKTQCETRFICRHTSSLPRNLCPAIDYNGQNIFAHGVKLTVVEDMIS